MRGELAEVKRRLQFRDAILTWDEGLQADELVLQRADLLSLRDRVCKLGFSGMSKHRWRVTSANPIFVLYLLLLLQSFGQHSTCKVFHREVASMQPCLHFRADFD